MKLLPSGGEVVFFWRGLRLTWNRPTAWQEWLVFFPYSLYGVLVGSLVVAFFLILRLSLMAVARIFKGQTALIDLASRRYQAALGASPLPWVRLYAWWLFQLLVRLSGFPPLYLYTKMYTFWIKCAQRSRVPNAQGEGDAKERSVP